MAVAAELTALGRCWFWLLVGLQAISVYGAQLSSEACRELGFSSNLLCSSCNLLGQFSLNQLDPFCRQCCQEEAQLETRKVTSGGSKSWPGNSRHENGWLRWQVVVALCRSCPRGMWMKIGKVPSSPGYKIIKSVVWSSPFCLFICTNGDILHKLVSTFVRSDKPKLFRGLQIKYVRGSDPVLKLLDDSGNIAEELSILKWNTDSVEEFLSEKLERL